MFSVEKRRLQEDVTAAFLYIKDAYKKDTVTGQVTGLFTVRVMRLWNTFLREVVEAPLWDVFNIRLVRALKSMI